MTNTLRKHLVRVHDVVRADHSRRCTLVCVYVVCIIARASVTLHPFAQEMCVSMCVLRDDTCGGAHAGCAMCLGSSRILCYRLRRLYAAGSYSLDPLRDRR